MRLQLDTHLQACISCANEVATLRQMTASLQALGSVKAPADFLSGVQQQLQRQPAWQRWFDWQAMAMPSRVLALGLTAVLVACVATLPAIFRARHQAAPMMLASAPALRETHAELKKDMLQAAPERRLKASSGAIVADKLEPATERAAVPPSAASADREEAAGDFYRNESGTADAPGLATGAATPVTNTAQVAGGAAGSTVKSISAVSPAPIRMQWVVVSQPAAIAALQSWVNRTSGATLVVDGAHVIIQVPMPQVYDQLLVELNAHGTIASSKDAESDASKEVVSQLSDHKEVMENTRFDAVLLGSPLTVELTLVSPTQ